MLANFENPLTPTSYVQGGLNVSHGSTNSPCRRQNPGLRSSCDACTELKLRCDHVRPACGRCLKKKVPCTYSVAKRPGRRGRLTTRNSQKDAINCETSGLGSYLRRKSCSTETNDQTINVAADEGIVSSTTDTDTLGSATHWNLFDEILEDEEHSSPGKDKSTSQRRSDMGEVEAFSVSDLIGASCSTVLATDGTTLGDTDGAAASKMPDFRPDIDFMTSTLLRPSALRFSNGCLLLSHLMMSPGLLTTEGFAPLHCLCWSASVNLQLHVQAADSVSPDKKFGSWLEVQTALTYTWDIQQHCRLCSFSYLIQMICLTVMEQVLFHYRDLLVLLERSPDMPAFSGDHLYSGTEDGHVRDTKLSFGSRNICGSVKTVILSRLISLKLGNLGMMLREMHKATDRSLESALTLSLRHFIEERIECLESLIGLSAAIGENGFITKSVR